MPPWKRVRTGCWTCRRRGYRCDEAKPACNACTRLCIPCEGYGIRLRWLPPSLNLRGSVVTKASTPTSKAVLRDGPGYQPSNPQIPISSSLPSMLSDEQMFLLQHFYYTVSGLLSSTYDTSINTYCRVILPMGMSCNLLLDAIMSVSATHLATRYESFRIPSILYRDRVLNGLINSIHAQDGFQMTTLATIIMLIIHEVFEADAESWVKHLKAAGTFVRNYLQKCENPDTSTRMLFDIFLYHNALALISTKQSDLFMEYYTSNSWCALKDRSAFLASVDTLLSLVARLSVFATNPNVSNSDSERNPELSVIHRKLQLWSPPDDISDDARNTAEAMRHAALLYYNQLACPFGASNAVITSYQAIIDHLREISIFSPAVASHLWPLYTAGAASRHLNGTNDDREFISNRLSQMQASRSIKSIDRVRECLEKLWLGSGAEVDSRTSLVLF